ncbi:hypothetical protein [Spiroplasma sp. AdecLV25b]|uniref:hypothetical protein n=1 Tax=Spiroplasma sp. AdecLV25b TaxID=3027162 RepID=UPI0027E0252D|nr:hypothetical protein [Spiroplasma sp. AdecLV25b]
MLKLTDKVYGGISPLGIQSEPVASTLLQSFVTNTKNKLTELGVLTWDLSNVDLSLTSTALTAKNNVLMHVVKDIISSGGQVVSETYQTTAAGQGNYKVNIIAKYTTNTSEIKTVEMNTFTTNFNEYQLNNGSFRLEADLNYQKSELDHTDHQFNSDIKLPDLGFAYYGHQIKDMFTNNDQYHNDILFYVIKVTNLDLKNIHVNKLVTAVEINNSFQTGADVDLSQTLIAEYVYLSITSSEAQGTFNLLIKC